MSRRQIATRIGQLLLVLVAVSILTFAVQSAGPVNRAQAMVGPASDLTPAQRTALIASESKLLGLDRPLPVQYGIWLWNAVRFRFGTAANGLSVRSAVGQRIGPSAELALASAVVSVPAALGLSLLASRKRRRRWLFRVLDIGLVTWLVLPSFWVGILLVLLLSIYVHWLPASGYVGFSSDPGGHIAHLVLPTVTLALPQIAIYYRYLEESLGRAMKSQYVRTARAKGLSERATLIRHALPNALLPMLTIFGIYLGTLMGGIVVVENVFNWPGIGSLLIYSVDQSDYDTTVAIVLASAVFFVVISFLVDLAQSVLDPPAPAVLAMRAAFAGNRMLKLGIALIIPFAICALIPGLIAPHPPDLTLAAPLQPPSGQYLLGTDEVGRDLLSRVIYAARVDLGVSVSSTVLATIVGSAIGLFVGYRGHTWDSIVMRSTDVLLAFPSILLAIFLLTIFGRTELVLIIALAILFVPGFIRLSRGLAVGIRESAFVSASEISGGHSLHVIRRHILPNASGPLLVGASLTAATSLLAESSLSYLGLGLPPPTPSWGNMLQSSFQWLFEAPLYGIFPGVCITLLALGFTWLAEGLRAIGQPAQTRGAMRLPTLTLQTEPQPSQSSAE